MKTDFWVQAICLVIFNLLMWLMVPALEWNTGVVIASVIASLGSVFILGVAWESLND